MSLPSKKQVIKERSWIDSLSFEKLYALYTEWPPGDNLSKTAHYPYVKGLLVQTIHNMAPKEYASFLKQHNAVTK